MPFLVSGRDGSHEEPRTSLSTGTIPTGREAIQSLTGKGVRETFTLETVPFAERTIGMLSSPKSEDGVAVFILLADVFYASLIILAVPLLPYLSVIILVVLARHATCVKIEFAPELVAQLLLKFLIPFIFINQDHADKAIQQQDRPNQVVVKEAEIKDAVEHVLGNLIVIPENVGRRDHRLDLNTGFLALPEVREDGVIRLVMTIGAMGSLPVTPEVVPPVTFVDRGTVLFVMFRQGFRIHVEWKRHVVAEFPMIGVVEEHMKFGAVASV